MALLASLYVRLCAGKLLRMRKRYDETVFDADCCCAGGGTASVSRRHAVSDDDLYFHADTGCGAAAGGSRYGTGGGHAVRGTLDDKGSLIQLVPKFHLGTREISQRGNRRLPVFFCDADYRAYLSLLSHFCAQYQMILWVYCTCVRNCIS